MIDTRWRKALRDLWQNKGRTLVVIAAIAVGVAATGSILTGYSVITREMDRGYQETNPASAVFYLDSVDQDLVDTVRARPEIQAVEARGEVRARLVRGPDEWIPLVLVVVADFDTLEVSRFNPDSGDWGPTGNEIVIERSSLDEVDLAIGDNLEITVGSGEANSLAVAGLVHDPGRTPAWMSGIVNGYVTPAGLETLGEEPVLDQLQVVLDESNDRPENRALAEALRSDLESRGLAVSTFDVPVPGEHPSQAATTTMLFLLQAFGAVALLASGTLVAILISAQLKQQSREIGVMKAVGAQTGQIARIYLGSIGLVAVIGMAVGIPLGILGGRGFIAFVFGLLNFEVQSYRLDAWVIPIQVLAALAIPLSAVVYPVQRSSRLPVREVLVDGVSVNRAGRRSFAGSSRTRAATPKWVSRVTRLGIRNAFRTPSRTILTVAALSVGGAAFMVALNTGVAWGRAVDAEFEARQYELAVDLDGAYPSDQVELALAGLPGISAVETWNRYPSSAQLPAGGTGDRFDLFVPPSETAMVEFPVLEGRWLAPDDRDVIVVTHALDDPAPVVGSTVVLEVDGTSSSWTVVGKVRQLTGGENGAVYASNRPDGIGEAGSGNQVRVANTDGVGSTLAAVESRLRDVGIDVVGIATAAEGRESLDDHLLIIVGLLIIMAILISVVGGLGLIEAMSISVLERRRELGVMRAVGASTGNVLRLVVVEGVAIAALSWLVSLALSIPATVAVARITGDLFLQTPLTTSFSATGIGLWLLIVVALAVVSSAIPALETTESPVHQALAYE